MTHTIVWRGKKAKSVVQNMLLAFFTSDREAPKKAKSVRKCAQNQRLSQSRLGVTAQHTFYLQSELPFRCIRRLFERISMKDRANHKCETEILVVSRQPLVCVAHCVTNSKVWPFLNRYASLIVCFQGKFCAPLS